MSISVEMLIESILEKTILVLGLTALISAVLLVHPIVSDARTRTIWEWRLLKAFITSTLLLITFLFVAAWVLPVR